MRVNFCNYKNALALILDRFCDDFLGSAVALYLRGVNQAHAELDSQTQRRDFPGTRPLTFAHPPRALSKGWNTLAIRQCDCFYRTRHE